MTIAQVNIGSQYQRFLVDSFKFALSKLNCSVFGLSGRADNKIPEGRWSRRGLNSYS